MQNRNALDNKNCINCTFTGSLDVTCFYLCFMFSFYVFSRLLWIYIKKNNWLYIYFKKLLTQNSQVEAALRPKNFHFEVLVQCIWCVAPDATGNPRTYGLFQFSGKKRLSNAPRQISIPFFFIFHSRVGLNQFSFIAPAAMHSLIITYWRLKSSVLLYGQHSNQVKKTNTHQLQFDEDIMAQIELAPLHPHITKNRFQAWAWTNN